jgi:hypothetical protein
MSTEPADTQSDQVPSPGVPSTDEYPETYYDREDDRYQPRSRLRDWGIIIIMIATYLVWTGIVYFLEPGIR